MFVNFSNHPSTKWEEEQIRAAECYGNIVDISFPQVKASADEEEIRAMAKEYSELIAYNVGTAGAAMVQGEFTLVHAIVDLLKNINITVLSACSERDVVEAADKDGNPVKVTRFKFVRFRQY